MNNPSQSPHVRNIALDIVLTIITCFLYNFYLQYKQMQAVNDMIKENKYDFAMWLLLTIVTCGLYHCYHEFRKSEDIARAMGKTSSNDGLVSLILSIMGMSIIVDAIQQSEINRYYGSTAL